jgi:hypothetical protein
MRAILNALAMIVVAGTLSGCAAAQTAIAKRDLDVQSRMSDTIFLDPVAERKKTVYVQVRNTSDRADFDIAEDLREHISARGYRVVNDFSQAHYLMQVNILQVGKIDPSAAERMFLAGYGSRAGSTLAGATIGAVGGGTWQAAGIGGLVGAAASTVADAFVKDVTYSVITDVQISEKSSTAVRHRTNQRLRQGRSGTLDVSADETSNMKRYQTRVMSAANQVNLELDQALPELRAGITRSIAGIL